MRRRRASVISGIFVSGPWREEDGDPLQPKMVRGVQVVERLGEDPRGRSALVRLADRRYALTGSTTVIAPAHKLDRYLRRRGRDPFGELWSQEARELLRRQRSRRTDPSVGRP
jgi:hypothetical protein